MGIFRNNGNHTCPLPKDEADLLLKAEPIAGSLTFQHIIAIIAAACAAITLALSLWLILKHLHRYTVPSQQRQIIRIVFTPVVFGVFSLLSILFYDDAIYLNPVRDLYEAFALVSLYMLFIDFLTPSFTQRDREAYFSQLPPPSAQYHLRYALISAYLFVSIVMTITQIASQATGDYCATSLAPRFAHLWVVVIQNFAIAVAVITIIRLYQRFKSVPEFAAHKPFLKLVSFKLIVGLNFLQNIIFNALIGHRVFHGSRHITGKDLAIGIPALLVAVEQVCFAIFFHYSFRSREYSEGQQDLPAPGASTSRRMGMFRAAAHAFNPLDYFYNMGHAITLVTSGALQAGSASNDRQSHRQDESRYELYPPTQQQQAFHGHGAAHKQPA